MAIQNPLKNITVKALWGIALVALFLAICTSAFPVNLDEDSENIGLGEDFEHPINEERRAQSAALWFHRNGKSKPASAPMWFHGKRNGEGVAPLWFHRAGRGGPVAAPMWFHGKRDGQIQLSPQDQELLQEMLEQARQK